MGEHGGEKHKIKGFTFVWKIVFGCSVFSMRVVFFVEHISQLKMEVWIFRGDLFPAPVNPIRNDIKSLITTPFIQIFCERNGHSTNATSDIEHPFIGFEPAKFSEIPEKLLPCALKIVLSTNKELSLRRG